MACLAVVSSALAAPPDPLPSSPGPGEPPAPAASRSTEDRSPGPRVSPGSIKLHADAEVVPAQAEATPPPTAPAPPVPPPGLPPPSGAAAPEGASNDALLERLRKMEEMNLKLLRRVETLTEQNEALAKQFQGLSKKVEGSSGRAEGDRGRAGDESEESGLAGPGGFKPAPPDAGLGSVSPEAIEGSGMRSGGARQAPYAQGEGNRYLGKIPLRAFYDYGQNGVGLETRDQEFLMMVRGEFQADSLIFANPRDSTVFHDGFYLPRVRYYFQGRFTKPVDYQLSFQRSYTTFGFLNVFLNFNYDPRLQFRVGRFKVPFTYDWYKLNNWRFITPERPLFELNFGLNRQVGGMAWGQLFEGVVEYAVGLFDGPRNSFQDYNNAKDVVAFLNLRPFGRGDSPLKNLNIGGSVDYGSQANPVLQPAVFRTNVNAAAEGTDGTAPINNATLPFLAFNRGVEERGVRELWSLHLAYYYEGLSLIASWGAGFQSYAPTGGRPIPVAAHGFSVALAYLLTGETLNERAVVDPIRRFDLRPGKFGLGAFEPFARYCYLNLDEDVFTRGLADPNLWTNRVGLVDVGMNWYLNRAVRIYFDWEHAMFAQPVFYRPGALSLTNNLLWMRFQLYY